jgi:hypothetical protein
MDAKKRLSELVELRGDPLDIPTPANLGDAKACKDWMPAESTAYSDRLSSSSPSDRLGGGGPKIRGMIGNFIRKYFVGLTVS